MTNYEDLTGRKFSYLSVTSEAPLYRSPKGKPYRMWNVRCDCGRTKIVRGASLRRGNVQTCALASCQFAHKLHTTKVTKPDAAFRQILGWYKVRSAKKHRTFSLNVADVKVLVVQDCHYCGRPPNNIARGDSWFSTMRYTGIDRIRNEDGYVPGNVLPCCSLCNTMKGILSHDQFVNHIKLLYLRLCAPQYL
jgi:hypothetical protein